MRRLGAVCGVGLASATVFATPARTLAATVPACEPGVNVPESPGGPILLIAAAVTMVGALVWIRRRGGAPPAAVATLLVVVISGAVVGMTVAGAATDPCNGGGVSGSGSGGGVLGSATGTPITGAAIPWLTGGVLVALGVLAVRIARRRRSPGRRIRAGLRRSPREDRVRVDQRPAAQAATVIVGVRRTMDPAGHGRMMQPRVSSHAEPSGDAGEAGPDPRDA